MAYSGRGRQNCRSFLLKKLHKSAHRGREQSDYHRLQKLVMDTSSKRRSGLLTEGAKWVTEKLSHSAESGRMAFVSLAQRVLSRCW